MFHMFIPPWVLSPLVVNLDSPGVVVSWSPLSLCVIELSSEAGSRHYAYTWVQGAGLVPLSKDNKGEGKETLVCLLGSS